MSCMLGLLSKFFLFLYCFVARKNSVFTMRNKVKVPEVLFWWVRHQCTRSYNICAHEKIGLGFIGGSFCIFWHVHEFRLLWVFGWSKTLELSVFIFRDLEVRATVFFTSKIHALNTFKIGSCLKKWCNAILRDQWLLRIGKTGWTVVRLPLGSRLY
jgi:hypothetical protein